MLIDKQMCMKGFYLAAATMQGNDIALLRDLLYLCCNSINKWLSSHSASPIRVLYVDAGLIP